jgi:hypothetical protein
VACRERWLPIIGIGALLDAHATLGRIVAGESHVADPHVADVAGATAGGPSQVMKAYGA